MRRLSGGISARNSYFVQDNIDRLGFLVVLERDQERSLRLADELLAETRFSIAGAA